MQQIDQFRDLLLQPKRIIITTHIKPDADALGSSLGLANYLLAKGHHVDVITPTDYPEFLAWMKGNDAVINFEDGNETLSAKLIDAADIIFCLDFSTLSRIEKVGELVAASNAVKVLIDHHLNPGDFADYSLWTIEAAATAELVFQLIEQLGDKSLIDKDIAECLYAGIMTDTGSFRHPSTSSSVHRIVADLIDSGADVTKVSKLIYDNNSIDRLKFLGFAFSQRLQVLPEFGVAYFVISKEDLKKFNSKNGDTEGLVNYALSIKGVVMAATIIERDGKVKMSFRSMGDFSVNQFARDNFSGGGHKNAAGGASNDSLEATVEKFKNLLPLYKEDLNKNISFLHV
jgi:bifunctional oligoribonuclease and PAP phosphatase NrnA